MVNGLKQKICYETIQPSEIKIDWNSLEKDVDIGLVKIDKNKIEKYNRGIQKYKDAKNNCNKISIQN